jgi:hypothetical protein
MRKFLISAALISTTAISAAPASAQSWGNNRGYNSGQNVQQQISQLVDRIRRAEDRDIISQREEQRLLRQANQVNNLFQRYRRNGLTQWEHRDLQQRIQNVRAQLRSERQEERYDDRRDRDRDWDRRDRRDRDDD